jgi:hypothetical protein
LASLVWFTVSRVHGRQPRLVSLREPDAKTSCAAGKRTLWSVTGRPCLNARVLTEVPDAAGVANPSDGPAKTSSCFMPRWSATGDGWRRQTCAPGDRSSGSGPLPAPAGHALRQRNVRRGTTPAR